MADTSVGECYPFGGRGGMTAPASVPVMITNLTMPNLSRTSPSRRSRGYPVLLLAIALITAGCTSTGSAGSAGWIDTSRPSEVDGHPPVQDIAWEDCTAAVEQILGEPFPLPVRFDCARLEVPADYEDPEAGLLELEVLRAVSTAADRDRIGSLVVNPGGPGVSGLEAALTVALLSPEELLSGFDIVGFDPRGVGRSSPIECVDDRFKDELVGADPTPTSEPEIAAAIERFTQLVTACQDTHGERLANFNTGYTARDMDRLREALGDEQLTYLGYSYGTTLGSTYAELFPERVRAMVLDGAVDPDLGPVEFVQGQAAGFEQAFDTFAQACIAIGPACPIGPDPRQFVTELLAAAERNPIPQASGDPRQGTAGFVFNGVVAALYAEETWPHPRGLHQPTRGEHDHQLQRLRCPDQRARDPCLRRGVEHDVPAVRCFRRRLAVNLRRLGQRPEPAARTRRRRCGSGPGDRHRGRPGDAVRRFAGDGRAAGLRCAVDLGGSGTHRLSEDGVHHGRRGRLSPRPRSPGGGYDLPRLTPNVLPPVVRTKVTAPPADRSGPRRP